MAIGYARVEFVKRSNGKTACAKAAYNAKTCIEFQGNSYLGPETYNWSSKTPPAYHEILLASGVHEKFKSPQTLWNAVECKEKKINSQVAIELLLALPDDKVITVDDRIHLAKTFIQEHFINKGLAAQIDIHSPERRIQITQNNKEKGLFKGMNGNIIEEKPNSWTVQFDSSRKISFDPNEFTGFIERENNWHAHVLITTRRFQENGLDLGEKARDLMPRICNGKVISGADWGKLWIDHQNRYFQSKGLNLQVDPTGIQPQEHLGPFRMRGRAFSLLEEHGRLIEKNEILSKNPHEILNKLTERQSVFTKEDLDAFLEKHVPFDLQKTLKEAFWKQKEVIPLINKETGEFTGKFSSESVINEERQILRLADHIHAKNTFKISYQNAPDFSRSLNSEQRIAFDSIIHAKKLVCLQGYAGTGKSYLLASLKDFYSHAGYKVRAFGPDSATADILKEKGFASSENIFRFLFGLHNNRRKIAKGNEVWILDEAGKLGNRPLLELLKEAEKKDVKIILSGDNAQLFSVERGGMFQVFCERYEPFTLKDIQRQHDEKQREISKNLAFGEVNSAIDKLSVATLRWSTTKKEAIEELISKWSSDSLAFPNQRFLIIAHTNDEVRLLNEMVRIIRKERGELLGKEYECETSVGKIYVSVGDRIEFRKNDKELGVNNGLSGTLIETTPDKFTVSIQGKDPRIVTFNPREYHSYQLGYASTYFRSQGNTVDKAYVLHSPSLNKRLFYVGLTRHVEEVFYFVSKDQAYCLADLKRQASRSSAKENTLGFTSQGALEFEKKILHKQTEIQKLRESSSFVDRMKGYGLSAYSIVANKIEAIQEHYQDRSPSGEFYHLKPLNKPAQAVVQEVLTEDLSKQASNHIPKPLLSQKTPSQSIQNNSTLTRTEQSQHRNLEHFFEARKNTKSKLWEALAPQKQELVQHYFSAATQASVLHDVVEVEASSTTLELSTHFKEWQEVCGKRNACAYDLSQKVSSEELSAFLGKKVASFIQIQSSRHQIIVERNEKTKATHLEISLRENIVPLLYRLFPEGPTRKGKEEFRFGAKGSLSVIHSGEEAGKYYHFEKQEGGGILTLIQRELGLGHLEALEWAKDFLGVVHETHIPNTFLREPQSAAKKTDWISVKPDSMYLAPSLQQLGNQKLHHYFNEVARHPYRDENGQLLYYRLRLIDKADHSKKMTPPLSFGYWKSDPKHLCWELKGYNAEKAHLYNLHLLKEHPLATVLVVEGEKTADKALIHFSKDPFICMTWSGGAGAASCADWTPLVGRNVIIWPDNDKPGIKAAEDICHELRKVGIQSLKSIDPFLLQKHFPEKWDLADPLPSNLPKGLLQTLLDSSLQKGINPNQVIHRVSSLYRINDPIDRARVNEILWRVDERIRPELETKNEPLRNIHDTILNETAKILLKRNEWQDVIKDQITSGLQSRLSWQILIYEAQYGRSPNDREITGIKEVLKLPVISQIPKSSKEEELGLDKILANMCQQAFSGQKISKTDVQQSLSLITQSINMQCERLQGLEKSSMQQIQDLDISKLDMQR